MSKIKLPHSSGNSVSIAAPQSNPASDRTLYLPSNADGTVLTTTYAKAGNILQVVSAEKTDTASTNSTSYTDIAGLSLTLTPSSSSSKILVMADIKYGASDGGQEVFLRAVRGSTVIYVGTSVSNRTACFFGTEDTDDTRAPYEMRQASANFLDSPSTTSATTYKVQFAVGGSSNTAYVNRTGSDGDSVGFPRTASSIIAMEVAG